MNKRKQKIYIKEITERRNIIKGREVKEHGKKNIRQTERIKESKIRRINKRRWKRNGTEMRRRSINENVNQRDRTRVKKMREEGNEGTKEEIAAKANEEERKAEKQGKRLLRRRKRKTKGYY